MSDLLIRNIEMPKEGEGIIQLCPNLDVIPYTIKGRDDNRDEDFFSADYEHKTTAIELPPHGRLWDMDKVLDALQERMKIYEEMGFKDDSQEIQELIHIQADLIATVPTVLEASK